MGWKLNAFLFLCARFCLALGALLIGVPLIFYVFYRLWSSHGTSARGGSHWMAYLAVISILLALVAAANQGTYSPFFFGGVGVLLLGWSLFPGTLRRLFSGVRDGFARAVSPLANGRGQKPDVVPCVELTKVPLDHVDPKKSDPRERLLRFQRLAQALAEAGGGVELRIEFASGVGRIMLVALGRDSGRREPALLQMLRSQLPEFGPEESAIPLASASFFVSIEGVPEPSVDPLGPMAKFFIENRLDGRYSVTISPARVNPLSRWLAGRSQRKLAVASGFQRADDEVTTTVIDHPKRVEHDESVKRVERLSARTPVRVSVQVSAKLDLNAIHADLMNAVHLSSVMLRDGQQAVLPRDGT